MHHISTGSQYEANTGEQEERMSQGSQESIVYLIWIRLQKETSTGGSKATKREYRIAFECGFNKKQAHEDAMQLGEDISLYSNRDSMKSEHRRG